MPPLFLRACYGKVIYISNPKQDWTSCSILRCRTILSNADQLITASRYTIPNTYKSKADPRAARATYSNWKYSKTERTRYFATRYTMPGPMLRIHWLGLLLTVVSIISFWPTFYKEIYHTLWAYSSDIRGIVRSLRVWVQIFIKPMGANPKHRIFL